MPRKKSTHEKWKYRNSKLDPYTVEYEGKYYHREHREYFESLKDNLNSPTLSSFQGIHDYNEGTASSRTESISINAPSNTSTSTETQTTQQQSNISFSFTSKQQADNEGKLFCNYLKFRSSNRDDPWVYFNTNDPTFEILQTAIRLSLGDLNFISLLLLIFAFTVFTRLPTSHIEDLLSLFILVLPSDLVTHFPNNLYKFNQVFETILKPDYTRKSYCVSCFKTYERHAIDQNYHSFKEGVFVQFDLKSVLELKLKSKVFCNDLLEGIISSRIRDPERLHTITDGRILQEFRKYLNILYPLTSLSFSIFIDGVSVFRSSKTSITPSMFYL
jgi:hypothetical protein